MLHGRLSERREACVREAFATFGVIGMPGHFGDVPLPWHDHLQAQIDYLDSVGGAAGAARSFPRKARRVAARVAGRTWFHRYAAQLRRDFGEAWPDAHRAALCRRGVPSRDGGGWTTRLAITDPFLGDGGNGFWKRGVLPGIFAKPAAPTAAMVACVPPTIRGPSWL